MKGCLINKDMTGPKLGISLDVQAVTPLVSRLRTPETVGTVVGWEDIEIYLHPNKSARMMSHGLINPILNLLKCLQSALGVNSRACRRGGSLIRKTLLAKLTAKHERCTSAQCAVRTAKV